MAQGKKSQAVDIICDACGERKPHTDVCFDMGGCSHLLCFGCLSRQGCPAEDGMVACPVPGCVDGFLDQRSWEEGGENEAKEEENKKAEVAIAGYSREPEAIAEGKNSQVVDIICDACGERKPHTDVCFDMVGCSHLLCFGCLSRQGCPAGDGMVACPVPGCVDGFLDQRNWEEGGEDGAKEEENKEAEEEEEERGDHEEPPEDSFSCPICMEEKRQQEGFFGTSGCAHLFCSQCIAAYVEARVEENLVPIGCPDPGCEAGKLEPDACRAVIPPGVFERWGAALCEGAVAAQARFYCPYPDCSALLANEGDEEGRPMTESQCLHCQRTCCAQCRVPWHEGQSCVAYREASAAAAEEGLAKLMELAKVSQWQKCPKCGFMVDRVDGCVLIRCRCQHCFCYRCASPMDDADNRHFCAKCGLTWDN